jgi:hypothetical protein
MGDGDQAIVETNSTVAKINRTPHEDVWEKIITATFDADDTTAISQPITLNGIIRHVTVVLPLTTTTGTTSQVLITDNSGNTVFDSGELAENATHNFSIDIPLSGTIGVSVDYSAGSGDAVTQPVITLRGI